jgi:hypothetical protein
LCNPYWNFPSIERRYLFLHEHRRQCKGKIQYRSQENWMKINREKKWCRLLLSSLAEYSQVILFLLSDFPPVGLLKCPCGSFTTSLNISDCSILMLCDERKNLSNPVAQRFVVSQKVKDFHSLTCQKMFDMWAADKGDQDNSKSKRNYLNDKMNILRRRD